MPIRNVAGVVLFAIGAWVLFSAMRRRNRAVAAWRDAQAKGEHIDVYTSKKFALTSSIARPIVLVMLLMAALEVAGSYLAMGGSRLFSVLDLAGFLFVLAAYGVWFTISTRYRVVAPVRAG